VHFVHNSATGAGREGRTGGGERKKREKEREREREEEEEHESMGRWKNCCGPHEISYFSRRMMDDNSEA